MRSSLCIAYTLLSCYAIYILGTTILILNQLVTVLIRNTQALNTCHNTCASHNHQGDYISRF